MTSYDEDDNDGDDLLEDDDSFPPIWGPPTCLCEARQGVVWQEQAWRMKERVRSGHVTNRQLTPSIISVAGKDYQCSHRTMPQRGSRSAGHH